MSDSLKVESGKGWDDALCLKRDMAAQGRGARGGLKLEERAGKRVSFRLGWLEDGREPTVLGERMGMCASEQAGAGSSVEDGGRAGVDDGVGSLAQQRPPKSDASRRLGARTSRRC